MNSKNRGDISESVVITEFLKLGIPVSIPFGDNQKYDIIIDINGEFKSIQVKTGRFKNGCVEASICTSINTKNLVVEKQIKESYKGFVDFIAIYCNHFEEVYLIDPQLFGDRGVQLRVEPTKNNQSKNINWAKDYILRYSSVVRASL